VLRRLAVVALLAALAVLCLTTVASTQSGPPPGTFGGPSVFTATGTSVNSPPQAVTGTDGRRHLVYEIEVVNTSPLDIRMDSIAVLDGVTGATIASYAGEEEISPIMSTPLAPATAQLAAAQNGIVWLDVSFPKGTKLPARLTHRFVTTVSGENFPTREIAWVGAATRVDRTAPIVISPPLKGTRHFDGNGCCGASPHTRAMLTIDGERLLAQRYAIDWVRFDDQGRWVVGDPTVNENYIVFGDPIYAVAPGRVVSVLTDLPENTPPTPLADLNTQNALGNHIIQDLGGGRYALYAHMQPGSIPAGIRVGSRLARGEAIGRVGNTGSSTAPHLHFHISDGPDAVGSQGRPYVFDSFAFTHTVQNQEAVDEVFAPADLAPAAPPVRRTRQLPLTGDVVDFP
jgi:hypothetical protein